MSGLPEFNYPAFHRAAAALRAIGHTVHNPAENPVPPCGSWLGYMRMSIAQIANSDALVMLPGWQRSRGARVEFILAKLIGLFVYRAGDAGLTMEDKTALTVAMGDEMQAITMAGGNAPSRDQE
jgi:hypothetical protein